MDYFDALLKRFAPKEMKAQFALETKEKRNANSLAQVIQQQLPVATRKKVFRDLGEIQFGENAYEMIGTATSLGRAGVIDPQTALKHAGEAPEDIVRLWAQLLIAPSL